MSSPHTEQQLLIALLDGGEYELSQRALRDAKRDLKDHFSREPSESEIVQYVIDTLRSSEICLARAPQGDPPGSGGDAWQVTDPRRIFIKLRIHERRFGEVIAYVQSCHKSVHAQ